MEFQKKFFFVVFWLFSAVIGMQPCLAEDPVEFFVLICSYNNAKWCKKNLDSVFSQTYPHWKIHYVDACSTDETGDIVDKYVQERGFANKCTIVHKTKRTMASENFYYSIKKCAPRKVVVQLDGDDWLASPRVLEILARIYKDPNVWMTYGSQKNYPPKGTGHAEAYPEDVIRNNAFRKYKFVYGPLRTFYAALFQKISKEDFLYKGEFMKVTHDMAFGFPLLEMASHGHFRLLKDILYVYNHTNPLSDFRKVPQERREVESSIRTRLPYKPLDKLF